MEYNNLTLEEKEIVDIFISIQKACTPTSDARGWTIGMSGERNPFKSGRYGFLYRTTNVNFSRRILDYLAIQGMTKDPNLDDRTDDNISIYCLFLEYGRNVGTN
ncbi:MAG: hypothetical protein JWO09_882 [Bacteroidetes bacterium]|nr:hypothetical protein [Bacteroidota bacterium]